MIDEKQRLQQVLTLVDTTPQDQLEAAVAALPGGVDEALDAIFDLLATEFNPNKAKGKRGVFQFEVACQDEVRQRFVHVENHTCTVGRGGVAEGPDITIGIKLPDMLLMGVGKLPGAKAFMAGKLKLRGNPLFGTKLGDWFDHPPA